MNISIRSISDLTSLHKSAAKFRAIWSKYLHAYEGYNELKTMGYFPRHERESSDNHTYRLKNGYGPNYSAAVINVFDYYIRQSNRSRNFAGQSDDSLFGLFLENVDYYGTDYQTFFDANRKSASILGAIGILIDCPKTSTHNIQESVDKKIYPYLSSYDMLHILDWKYERNEDGRPDLTYLKLLDENGVYRIWTKTQWAEFEIATENGNQVVKRLGTDKNKLGEIPFATLKNGISKDLIATSDLKDVVDIDISIYRNVMAIEEIIDLAAFPMMRKPMKRRGGNVEEDRTGVSAVLEFDPTFPDGKPDWLQSEAKDPIDAIQEYMAWKITEIYRISMLSEASTSKKSAESGYALQIRRDLLQSALTTKSKMQVECEKTCVRFWLKWLGREKEFADMSWQLAHNYSVDMIKTTLESAIMANSVVKSTKFSQELQKKLARQVLGSEMAEKTLFEIDEEITSYEPNKLFDDSGREIDEDGHIIEANAGNPDAKGTKLPNKPGFIKSDGTTN